MPVKPRKIVRRKEAWGRLGCGRTKFIEDYEYHSADDPFVPGTQIPRVKSIPLGPVNRGFLDHEAARNAETGTRVFLTDALPPRLERERSELLERRKRLRAQMVGDSDPELRIQIEEVERALRAFDQPQK
jgi:hypothetical protein